MTPETRLWAGLTLLIAIIGVVVAGVMLLTGFVPAVIHDSAMQHGADLGLAMGVSVGAGLVFSLWMIFHA